MYIILANMYITFLYRYCYACLCTYEDSPRSTRVNTKKQNNFGKYIPTFIFQDIFLLAGLLDTLLPAMFNSFGGPFIEQELSNSSKQPLTAASTSLLANLLPPSYSLEKENNPSGLNLANRVRGEATRILIY